MAAIQTIRKWGVALLVVIGLGLFAFIAEDFFRVFDVLFGSDKRHVGQVYSNKLGINEYQSMIEEYTEAIKFTRGQSALSDAEQNQIKDQVWQTYVTTKLIEHEAEKLGLTVTDDELNNVIRTGTNPMLLQTPFVNKQTGRFDIAVLKQFLDQYEQMQANPDQVPQEYAEYYQNLYKYWGFVEKNLRSSLLNDKYQSLVGRAIVSNPLSAKLAFDGVSSKSNAVVASIPFTSIPDKEVNVTDEDIKKMYEQKKELFKQYSESRDIKYIGIQVTASPEDKAALEKEMKGYAAELEKSESVAGIVNTSSSLIPYTTLPVSKTVFPRDIQNALDSVSVGSVKGPYLNASDNTYNVIKLIATTQAPDSVQYRAINCANVSLDAAKNTADSIIKAVAAGAKFEDIAKKYNQPAESQWLTAAQYEGQNLDADNTKFIKAILNGTPNAVQKVDLAQNVVVIEVLARRAMATKYDAAVIKRTIDFSKETYSKAYNAFSHFIASNNTLEEMEKNAAKSGYNVQERKDMFSYEHYVAGIPSTKEALRWVFDAKKGDISQLYECGNNDHLLIVCVTDIHPDGYRSTEDPSVKEAVRNMVIREKKAEKIIASLKGKSVEQALANPAATKDTLNDININSYASVASTGASEPVLAGGISFGKLNKNYGPVKGNNGVYVYQVTGRTKTNDKYNQNQYEESVAESYLRYVGQYTTDLYRKANVKDRRYMYF